MGIWFFLVFLGYSVYGAIFGVVVSAFLGFLISFWYVSMYLKPYTPQWTHKALLSDFIQDKQSIFHFFLVSLLFAFLMNCDVLFARNIFDAHMAGIYAGISILGKFLIFALLSIETVYYGQIMQYTRDKLPFNAIRKPVLCILAGGGVALIVNYFVWGWVLGTLKAELSWYTTPYLLMLVYYVLLTFISLFSKVLVGWWNYRANYILLFTCLLLTGSVYLFGTANLYTFVLSLIVALGVGWFLLFWLFVYHWSHRNNTSS